MMVRVTARPVDADTARLTTPLQPGLAAVDTHSKSGTLDTTGPVPFSNDTELAENDSNNSPEAELSRVHRTKGGLRGKGLCLFDDTHTHAAHAYI